MAKQLQIFTALALSALVQCSPIQPDRLNLSNNKEGDFGHRTRQVFVNPPRVTDTGGQHDSSTPSQEPATSRVVSPEHPHPTSSPINDHVITVAPPSQTDTIKVIFPPSLLGGEPSSYAPTQTTAPTPLATPPSFQPNSVHINKYVPHQYELQTKQSEPQHHLAFPQPSHPYHYPAPKPHSHYPVAHPLHVRTHDKRNIMYPSSFENHAGFGSFVGYPTGAAPVPMYNRYPVFPSYPSYHTFDEPVYPSYPAARVSYTPLPLPLAALARLYLMLASNTSNMFETLKNLFA